MIKPRYRLLYSILALFAFTLVTPLHGHAQPTGTVQGQVVDASEGSPLPGANVIVEGTSIGTSTNTDGRFQLTDVPTGSQTLTVSFVSYQSSRKTVDVQAGQAQTINFELASEVLEGGEVVVRGLRESQFRSVNQKRQSMNIVDALAADRIGNLPEKNVAEAVQRLPGIVLRNDRTEGRFVSIRGGAANLNNVTLNGNTLASTAGSRATALDLLPAEMVSNVEVTKAVTPDMPGNAIGGSINISTLSAFDREGSFAFGSVRALSHNQTVPELGESKLPFRANLTAGTKVGPDDSFGLLISASGSRRDFTTSGLKGEGWGEFSGEGSIDLRPDFGGTVVPEAQEQIVERNRRRRFAINSTIDWRPDNTTEVFFRPYYTFNDEKKLDNELEYNMVYDPEDYPEDPRPSMTESGARFARGFGSVDLSDTDEDESLWGGNLGFEQKFDGAITLSASGTYSRGVTDQRQEDAEFETPETTQAAGVADMGNFLFDYYPENPGYVGDGSNYVANEVDLEYAESIENTYAAQADLRIPFSAGGVSGFVKTGGQFQTRDKSIDVADTGYDYVGDGSLTLADFEAPRVQTVQVGNGLMPFANTGAVENDFLGDLCNPTTEQRFSGERRCRAPNAVYERVSAQELAVSDIEDDSENAESIYAGYAMASAEFGSLTALGGLRVEHTATETDRFQLRDDGEFDPDEDVVRQTFENSYTNFLPSLHLTLEVAENIQLRAAWSNTIGRPEYDDLGAFSEVEVVEEGGSLRASVNEGNPNLDPFTAMNFDLGAEYYFSNGGLVSAGGFHKRVNNAIYRFSSEQRNVQDPFGQGRTFEVVNRSQLRNADLGTVTGLEVAYQQPFTFLPEPFNVLGLNANTTITTSNVDVPEYENDPNRPDYSFFQQADLVYNIIPYIQTGGFEARVAVNYQGDYLEDIDGSSPLEDEYVGDRTTVDVNATYQFQRVLGKPELILQVQNITNDPEVFQTGQTKRLGFHYLSGRTLTVGISTEF
ncbi:TonB-dependent receptor [Salinibacter grassmerensis]|uniref:TonB-dependent receptor n=1 Tax=Salinibacter grassmerensis TaxID=3040353 RepID=UPI0021E8DC33|nr:TonB-dependent receptor [Salinibacter grassmerensis]